MALRPELVKRKLQLIAQDLARLAEFRDLSLEALVADSVTLAAVERMLERVIMRAIDINEHLISELATGEEAKSTRLSYRDTFLALAALGVYTAEFAEQIAGSAGLRNILVHDYNDLDHRILHKALRERVAQYHAYARAVQEFIRGMPSR